MGGIEDGEKQPALLVELVQSRVDKGLKELCRLKLLALPLENRKVITQLISLLEWASQRYFNAAGMNYLQAPFSN